MRPLIFLGGKLQPREYQTSAVKAVRGEFRSGGKTALVVLPTGAGKSLTAAEFVRQLLEVQPSYRALVVVPRASIIDSFCRALTVCTGITPTIAAASSHGVDITGQLVVGMHQTLSRRVLPDFDLVIADEAHRINQARADSGYYSLVRKLMERGSRVLGFTATPFRQDGYIFGGPKLFGEPVYRRDLAWTTSEGFTVRAVLRAGSHSFDTKYLELGADGDYLASSVDSLVRDEPRMVSQVDDMLVRSVGRKKIAVCCANIRHAEDVAALLRARGERVSVVTSGIDINARRVELGDFESDPQTRWLVFVTIVAEGYDYPPTDCIVFLRPCRSSVFYIQCVGRGLRPFEDKKDCLVLDYGHVVENCGPLDRPIVNRGTGKSAQLQELAALPHDIISCPHCGQFLFPDKNAPRVVCDGCGQEVQKPERVVDKKLERRAAEDAALYTDEIEAAAFLDGEWEASGVVIDPGQGSQYDKRRKKFITILLKDGGCLEFQAMNPAFAPTTQLKYFYLKHEAQMQKLVDAVAGRAVSLRGIERQEFTAGGRVMVAATRRVPSVLHTHRPYDKYVSHRILPVDVDAEPEGSSDTAGLFDLAQSRRVVCMADSDAGSV
jgi:superfamily II DNA or RNA helicase/DNA-directed RNA polymerase subunit M/transcription elongation factor TFIIS